MPQVDRSGGRVLGDHDCAEGSAARVATTGLPDTVAAIANLERTGVEIAGGFWVLNAYRW